MSQLSQTTDQLYKYTVRIELKNGKVLLYTVDSLEKNKLEELLKEHSVGSNFTFHLDFIYFKINLGRMVLVKNVDIARLIICFDTACFLKNKDQYIDNFNLAEDDSDDADETISKVDTNEMITATKLLIPQAIIYHQGNAPSDEVQTNPLSYSSLPDGCLGNSFLDEIDGITKIRQFISLIDDDGENSYIPMWNVSVMEFDMKLLAPVED